MNSLEIDHRGACVLVGGLRIPLTAGGLLSPFHPLDLERWLPCSDGITIYRLELPWAEHNTSPSATLVSNSDAQHHLLERAKSAERAVANLRAKLAGLMGATDPVDPPQTASGPGEIPKSELQKNEINGLQSIIREGEQIRERLRERLASYSAQLVIRTTERDEARKELEELRTRVRNSLRAPDGFIKQ